VVVVVVVIVSSLPCIIVIALPCLALPRLAVAVTGLPAEPVKTGAVERTALLRLPSLLALLNPGPGPRVNTLNHRLLYGLYTPAIRLYHAQASYDLPQSLCWTTNSSVLDSIAALNRLAVSLTLTRSSALRRD